MDDPIKNIFLTEIPKLKKLSKEEGIAIGYLKGVIVGALLTMFVVFALFQICRESCQSIFDFLTNSYFSIVPYILSPFLAAIVIKNDFKNKYFRKAHLYVFGFFMIVVLFMIVFV